MRILVTGGAGYVGSVLVPMLLHAGHHVRVVDSLLYGGEGLLPNFGHKHFEFAKGDIRDEGTVAMAYQDADAIIHLAAIVGYPACKKDPALAHQTNVLGTQLLEISRRREQPIVFASTGSNYGAVDGQVCTEETPLNPLTVYGQTKTEAEETLRKAGNAVCLRFATAFGVSPRMRFDLLINDFVYRAARERNLVVYERGHRRSFIHVRDMARAFLFALENLPRMVDEVFNVGSEEMNLSKEEIAFLVREHIDYYLHFADFGRDEDQRNYEVSYAKLRSLGYQTTVSLEEGITGLLGVCAVLERRTPYSNV